MMILFDHKTTKEEEYDPRMVEKELPLVSFCPWLLLSVKLIL